MAILREKREFIMNNGQVVKNLALLKLNRYIEKQLSFGCNLIVLMNRKKISCEQKPQFVRIQFCKHIRGEMIDFFFKENASFAENLQGF